MFEYLCGIIEYKKIDYIALDINGIGYKIYISLREYENLIVGEKYKLYIYNHLKEDTNKLIGFSDEKERKLFEMLISVKGIGISLGLAILSTFSYDKVIDLIIAEDVNSLKKVPKLGEKKAKFIIVELKKKLSEIKINTSEVENISSYILDDLILALESLGYTNKEINKILNCVDLNKFSNVEEAIKEVLKNIKMEG